MTKTVKASLKNALILGCFALLSTSLIAFTHWLTKEKIAHEIQAATGRLLEQIISPDEYDNDIYRDCLLLSISETSTDAEKEKLKLYRLRKQQEDYAVFISSIAPDGYSGKIKLVVGVHQNGTIAGVRVTEHQETPGLGDKIQVEKSAWITQFDGKSLSSNPAASWQVRKDGGEFDALSGATITSRAIVKAVHDSLSYYRQNKSSLFEMSANCGGSE